MPPEIKPPNSSEIEQALKEFEMKSGSIPESPSGQTLPIPNEASGMVRLVMKLSGGAIKEQRQAEYVLLGFTILVVGVSIYLFFGV